MYLSRARFPYSTATESLAVRLVPLALAGSGDAHELYKARESPSSLELISILGFEFCRADIADLGGVCIEYEDQRFDSTGSGDKMSKKLIRGEIFIEIKEVFRLESPVFGLESPVSSLRSRSAIH